MIDFLLCFTLSHLQMTKFRMELVLEHSNMDTESKFNHKYHDASQNWKNPERYKTFKKNENRYNNLTKLSFSLNCHYRSTFLAKG